MQDQLFSNFTRSRLAAPITDIQTSLSVVAGAGAKFPALTPPQFLIAAIYEINIGYEIVKVTARVTDTFTIVRNQESSGAKSFTTNAEIYLADTASLWTWVINSITGQIVQLGYDSFAHAGYAIAIGNLAKANQPFSVAVGAPSTSNNQYGVAINSRWDRLLSPSIASPKTMGEISQFTQGVYGAEFSEYCGIQTKFMTEFIDLCGGVTWTTATAIYQNKFVKPTTPNGRMYARWDNSYPYNDALPYTPSTGGTIEPTWPTTTFAFVADNLANGSFACINPANYAIPFANKFVVEGIDILVYNISGVTVQATIDIGTQASGTALVAGHVTNLAAQDQLEKITITPKAVNDLKINISTLATGTELLVRFVVHGYYVKGV